MNTTTQTHTASVYNIPERPRARIPTPPTTASVYNIPERPRAYVPTLPLLRYEEEHPTIIVSDADEQYCLTGYGDLPVSEQYNAVETGEDDQRLRVPQLQHMRPRAQYQTTKTFSRPLEPEVFRDVIHATSANPPDTQNADFRVFFENLLRKTPPTRRQRSLIPQTSPAPEVVDVHPRSN